MRHTLEETEVEQDSLWYEASCLDCSWSIQAKRQPVQNDCYDHVFATGHTLEFGFKSTSQMRLRTN